MGGQAAGRAGAARARGADGTFARPQSASSCRVSLLTAAVWAGARPGRALAHLPTDLLRLQGRRLLRRGHGIRARRLHLLWDREVPGQLCKGARRARPSPLANHETPTRLPPPQRTSSTCCASGCPPTSSASRRPFSPSPPPRLRQHAALPTPHAGVNRCRSTCGCQCGTSSRSSGRRTSRLHARGIRCASGCAGAFFFSLLRVRVY